MANPYDIYGDVVEFRCPFGRLFVHVNIAPKQHHRHRLDAIEAAVRDMMEIPDDGDTEELPIGYAVKVWDWRVSKKIPCDRIKATFRKLNTLSEDAIDHTFAYQKGGIREDDVFIERLAFVPSSP